ncbi:MAG: DsbA family protein [Nanoarchaeota archaeon]|nr:DsbA family protein [Nanoarchaeota archaeon]MBU1321089.1 DsbA family protein [Nanoarchaeota archaeon]MBU1596952.1 DsbA family protein [Nanoarchaeota archaeon]MBU2441251.1 DsbA family protein [Nanoarchaeota archaeon]
MKTSEKKSGENKDSDNNQNNNATDKEKPKSEKTENIIAIAVFAVLIIIGIGIFTGWFGLADKNAKDAERIRVPIDNDPFTGGSEASVVIVGFSDYECPFCSKAEQTIMNILKKYPDEIVYVFKNYPLTKIHPNSYNAALAAECAKEQDKFWEYHEYLFAHNTELNEDMFKESALTFGLDSEKFNECFDSQRYKIGVDKDIQTAGVVGVTGTPTFFINGIKLVGAQPEEEFISLIEDELKKS